eukprot:m.13773 g.13773  ORF g.13773 m.13773 type:complete len:535 (-) comp6011_c0_seq2:721-2325(-)
MDLSLDTTQQLEPAQVRDVLMPPIIPKEEPQQQGAESLLPQQRHTLQFQPPFQMDPTLQGQMQEAMARLDDTAPAIPIPETIAYLSPKEQAAWQQDQAHNMELFGLDLTSQELVAGLIPQHNPESVMQMRQAHAEHAQEAQQEQEVNVQIPDIQEHVVDPPPPRAGEARGEQHEPCTFSLDTRYQNLSYLGHGAYGFVVSAQDTKTQSMVAIKKVSPFEFKTYCQKTYRELLLLKHFNHENIISLRDLYCQPSPDGLRSIYIVLELMEIDLHRLLQRDQLSPDHICYFTYQICRGLKYIHSANVLHRDLKPSNILVNTNCDLKICDFGLSRIADPAVDHMGILTEYVATRWYRAPEIMLNARAYDKPVDVWSVGCIFAEMVCRRPLFPGENLLDQVNLIFNVIGTPSEPNTRWISHDRARQYVLQLQPRRPQNMCHVLGISQNAVLEDLLQKLLAFNPDHRVTIDEVLTHPYFSEYYDPSDEPVCDEPFQFQNELDDLDKDTLRQWIYEAIWEYRYQQQVVEELNPQMDLVGLQ